jgi:hypothetical protein
MPTCTLDYVYFGGGRGRTRRPRTNTAFGGLTPIDALSGSFPLGAGTWPIPRGWYPNTQPLPATSTTNATTLQLAFVNVSGALTGNQTWLAGSPIPPSELTVGATPITLMIVYVPVPEGSGPGAPDTGASIDAYDESTGTLVDDLFVTVSPDNGQTTSGNNNGWVDTTNADETITANASITPTGRDPDQAVGDFDKWVNLQNPLSQLGSGAEFKALKGTNYYAFALYKSPPPPPQPDRCHQLAADTQALIAKEGALNIPIGVREQTKSALLACEHELGAARVNALIAELFPPQPPPPPPPPR